MRRGVAASAGVITRLACAAASVAVLVSACHSSSPPDANARPSARAARVELATTIRKSLHDEFLKQWYPRAVDRDSGGFLSQFDYRFNPDGTQEKMIVSQSRHVWTTARASQFFPGDSTGFLGESSHGFRFLRDRMWDKEKGGFYWLVTRGGTPKEDAPGRIIKQAYGTAFGIYALAAYYEVSHDEAALRMAQDAFRWVDQHAHDPVNLGYFNYMERDGTPIRAGYNNDPPKDQNSSIHLLEAFTELYHVWPDPVLRTRLAEMLALIRDRMRTDPGYLQLFFTENWTPVSYRDSSDAARERNHSRDHVSFGHDIETAYLMLEASEALGLEHDTVTERYAKQMVDHALRFGWDAARGGFYDEGYYFRDKPGFTLTHDTKNWWAQAEGLNTLLMMADRYPNDPLEYEKKFFQQWSYMDRFIIDHEFGGWFAGGLDREPDQRKGLKGHIWKATYHESRALMNVVRRLEAGH